MNEKKNKRSSQQDFEKYFAGELDSKASHKLESEALNDNFEYEAMEGWESTSLAENKKSIVEIRQNLNRRVANKQSIFLKMAAAITILLLSSATFYFLVSKKNNDTLALAKSSTLTEEEQNTQPTVSETPTSIVPEKKRIIEGPKVLNDDSQSNKASGITESSNSIGIASKLLEEFNEVPEEDFADYDAEIESMTEEMELGTTSEFSVVNEDENSASETGARELALSSPTPTADIGFDNDNAQDKIFSGSKKTKRAPEVFSAPRPKRGQKKFEDYLKKHLKMPELAKENEVTGNVILRIAIDSLGSIRQIEVVESLGFGCDEEAIRLVRKGPGWLPANRNGEAVRSNIELTISFP